MVGEEGGMSRTQSASWGPPQVECTGTSTPPSPHLESGLERALLFGKPGGRKKKRHGERKWNGLANEIYEKICFSKRYMINNSVNQKKKKKAYWNIRERDRESKVSRIIYIYIHNKKIKIIVF